MGHLLIFYVCEWRTIVTISGPYLQLLLDFRRRIGAMLVLILLAHELDAVTLVPLAVAGLSSLQRLTGLAPRGFLHGFLLFP